MMPSVSSPAPPSPAARRYLQLHLVDGIGPILLNRLVERFGSIEEVLAAPVHSLVEVDGIGKLRADAVIQARDESRALQEMERAAQLGVRILCPLDDDYPLALKRIPDPPLCLYVRGRLIEDDRVSMAIVGSRNCSHYGREQARRFGVSLAQAGFTVVSGLARGVDIAALQGAMDAGSRTLAVLGNGLSSIYPPEHAEAAEKIAQHGAVISEIPIDSPAAGENFPSRNRIIAGLSLGVLVVEAAKRSGALITARLANEYNREVFALPGRVDLKTAQGTNLLIREGHAKLVMGLEDILDELGELGSTLSKRLAGIAKASSEQEPTATRGRDGWTEEEGRVWDGLTVEFVDIDELILTTGLSAGQVMTALTRLQIRAMICTEGGRRFARRAP